MAACPRQQKKGLWPTLALAPSLSLPVGPWAGCWGGMSASSGGTECSERRRGRSRKSQIRGEARAQASDAPPRKRSLTSTQDFCPTHSPLHSRSRSPSPSAEEQDSEEARSQSRSHRKRSRRPFSSQTVSQLVPTLENGNYDFSARLPRPPATLSCPVCPQISTSFPLCRRISVANTQACSWMLPLSRV